VKSRNPIRRFFGSCTKSRSNGSASACWTKVSDCTKTRAEAPTSGTSLYQLFKKRDKEVARLFDDFRRSTALLQLAAIHGQGLLTEAEFARFSEETQEFITVLLGDWAG